MRWLLSCGGECGLLYGVVFALLIVVVRLVAQHSLWSMWPSLVAVPGLQSTGSIVVVHGLNCSLACGILLDQGLNPGLLHWQADSLPLSRQRSPQYIFCIDISKGLPKWLSGKETGCQYGRCRFNPWVRKIA